MSTKRRIFTAEFKTKLVLEVLKNDKTLNEIASQNNITPKNLQNWKKIFLENAEMAMEPAKAIKEYKDENIKLQSKIDGYAKIVGKMTVEKEWLEGKLQNLDSILKTIHLVLFVLRISSDKKELIEFELKYISVSTQCKLLNLNPSSLYYKPVVSKYKVSLKEQINKIYENIPIYGALKVHQQLLEDGYNVSLNTVYKYRQEMGLKPILAVKPINLTQPNKQHKKYSYKLKGIDIIRANQVWSTDKILYINILNVYLYKDDVLNLGGGMVYLAAIIDWYSKAVLSWKISNTMDTQLVTSVLNEALSLYGKPEIFNTDQGSQYTSYAHTQILKDNNISISMDGKGRATDNICIERFWRSAKVERIYLNEYKSIKELKEDTKDYIDFYNHKRFHQTLDYKKPMNVYYDSLKINDENYNKLSEIVA
jgi:putative transposase